MPDKRLEIPVDLRRIAAMPLVQKGEQHPDVGEVQNYLKRFGYLREEAVVATAEVDDPTSRGITRFQQRYGLEPTGELDEPTRRLMAADRCGLPDVSSPLAFSTTCSWPRRNLRFAFGPLSSQVTNAQARNAVISAFNSWAGTGAGLSFTEVTTADSPDFIVDWRAANDADLDMRGGTLAHADFPPGCSVVVANPPLPCHFDDEEHTWVIGAVAGGFDIETVALHEIGHLLGLAHTNVAGSVMLPFVSANFTRRAPQPDDIAGIRALYPPQTIRSTVPLVNSDGRLEVFAIGLATPAVFNMWQTAPSAGPWSTWNPLGGLVKQLSGSRNGDGRLEIFGIGMDDALWNNWQPAPSSGPWSGWSWLGGGVKQIAAASNADGRLEVFAIGMDNALWNNWQTAPSSGPWSGWSSLGGGVKRIAVQINSDGRLEVFAIGMDDALWNIWQTAPSAGPWSGWNSLGGVVKDILPLRNSDGRLEVFAIGSDDGVWNNWQTAPSAGPWSGWNPLGGVVKQIAGANNGDGRLEIFGIGTDDAVWNNWQPAPSSGPWSGWNSLGGIVKHVSAVCNADGRLEIFGVGSDDRLWNNWQTAPSSGPWSGWNQLG